MQHNLSEPATGLHISSGKLNNSPSKSLSSRGMQSVIFHSTNEQRDHGTLKHRTTHPREQAAVKLE